MDESRIEVGTPEFRTIYEGLRRAVALTERLNALSFTAPEAIREVFAELTGVPVPEGFSLIPPFYTDYGRNIRLGRNVFFNQGCTLLDIGGIEIGEGAMIGPKVNIVTSGHPLDPARRRRFVTTRPIVIGANVWIGAAATILPGVTIGTDAVVAAGAVVSRDVPPRSLAAGVPAEVIRTLEG
jgi:acetyltransferase-like isoleucine patch superfamily enzyme